MASPKIPILNKVKTESVFKGTSQNWNWWVAYFEKKRAHSWSHQDFVKHLKDEFKLSLWWQQQVAMGVQIALGLREEGRSLKGDYSCTITKTVPLSQKNLWKWLCSSKGIHIWLDPFFKFNFKLKSHFETKDGYVGQIRTIDLYHRIRMSWHHPEWNYKTYVVIYLIHKGSDKSHLVISHNQIKNQIDREQFRKRWKNALSNL